MNCKKGRLRMIHLVESILCGIGVLFLLLYLTKTLGVTKKALWATFLNLLSSDEK